jgi:hypothetical protein
MYHETLPTEVLWRVLREVECPLTSISLVNRSPRDVTEPILYEGFRGEGRFALEDYLKATIQRP